ncbi:hypothetical protein BU074_10640 [Mammaliicoccus vitulinus]|nr:hypothetical protein BU074_10640 [Mammaliicoccus vitulinus]
MLQDSTNKQHRTPVCFKIWVKRTKTQKISCDSGKIWIILTKTRKISCDFGKIWVNFNGYQYKKRA